MGAITHLDFVAYFQPVTGAAVGSCILRRFHLLCVQQRTDAALEIQEHPIPHLVGDLALELLVDRQGWFLLSRLAVALDCSTT